MSHLIEVDQPADHAKATSFRPRELAEFSILGFIALVAVVLFSPLNMPILQRDEGVFVYIGRSVLEGKIPYRDAWDHKGPLIYYLDALGLWIGHNSLWGIWAVEAITLGLALLLLYLLLRRTLPAGAAIFGLIAWLAGFVIVMGGNIVEEYAILPAVLALYLVMYRPPFAAGLAGILAGILFMLRPNEAAAPAVALAFLAADQARSGNLRKAWLELAQFAFGFGLVVLTVAAYFWSNRALGDFISDVFVFNYHYVSEGGSVPASLLSGMAYLAVPIFFSLACLVCTALPGRPALLQGQRRLLCFAVVLLLVTVPLSILSGRVYRHYYVSWLLPLTVLSAYFLFILQGSRVSPALKKGLWRLAWIMLLVATIVGIRIRAVPLLAGGTSPDETRAIQSIQSFVPEGRKMFIWGNETSYSVMADRTIASRYLYIAPILSPGYGETLAPRLLRDIETSRPIIIDTSATDPDIPSLKGNPPTPYLSALYDFIHGNYKISGTIAGKGWVIWVPD